jgi:gliding motility-associated-like protein
VTLNVNANPVCNGTPVTFEANGGSQYTFFENGTTVQGPIATNTYSPVTLINGNIYTAQAIDTYGCVSDLSTPITLTVNPIPSAVIVSDKTGDAVCSGSTITFTGSSDILGSEFEFYVNGTVAQAKSLNASFATNALVNGNQVHVVAYASTGCYSASTPITVTVNDLPPISIDVINPGTSVIEGTNVSFTSSVITGGTFSWLVNTTTVQPFGPSNSYSSNTLANGDQITVVGQDANGCQNSASVTMSVYESVQPLAVTVSPNGYCTTSATGVTISASNPQAGVVYELIRNSDNVNLGTGTISGTVVNWANIKNTGIGSADYRVEAYQTAVPSVRVAMANTVTVTEYALPLVYNVSPNNTVTDCNGGTGYEIKLSSSEVGVTYTLLRDGAPFGTPLAGTGNELSFGFQKTHGQYTISASLDAIGACSQLMNGTFIIDLSALGSVYNIASDRADGLYCQGDAGVRIYLDDTQNGVTYTLLLNGADQGTTVVGNGNAVDFGTFTTEGSYSAVVRQGGCDLAMNGTVNVTMIPTPKQFNLSIANNGHLCAGSTTGLAITLDGQQNGYTYHLYRQPAVLVESIVSTATDETTDLVFAGVTTPGTYYVSVASNGPGCTNTMANTVDVVVDDLPNEVTLKSDLPTICAGNTTVLYIEYAYSNTDYYLQLNGVDTGSPLSGNDGRLDFPAVSAPGTYSLRAVAHHTDTDCEALLTSTVEVITSALPEVRYITVVDGTTCANPTIVTVESTQVGVTYELFSAATNAIVPGYSILGDGNNQSFAGIVDADGHYYVIAHNAAGCQLAIARIDGTADIHVNIPGVVSALAVNDPNPLSRCVGDDSGFIISMPNSEATVSYVLIDPFNNEVETVVSSGGPLSFNPVTVAGTYTVRGYNAADPTCIVNMLNSINVVYTPLPAATLDASPATTIISGTDVTFTAGGGLYYQFIRLNGVPTLEQAYSADATFNSQFINNNDTIIAYVRDANGCESSAQVIMTVLPSIIVQPVYASATTYCVSSNGVSIMIANPQANVSYELFDGNNASRGVGIFDGTVVRWDNIKNSVGALETYRVEAYYPIYTTARVVMGSIAISEVAVPTVYSIPTETHNDCNSGAGYDITLSGSEVGVTYELLPIGTKIAGTGSALTFPSNTFIADYQVVATNDLANSCSILMDGTFTISIPTTISQYDLFSIRADGQFCQGSDGVEILLNNSSDVVAYSLWKDGQLTSTLTGINDTLSFGKFTEEALYRATADVNGCQLIMNGSVLVQEVETPKAFDVIADNNGHYCSDDASGVNITLQGQQKDVVYTLMLNGVAIIAETGKDVPEATVIPFGMYTEEGEYTIVAHIPGIGCTNVMNDTVYVVKDQLPANYELLATNSTYCTGGTTTLYIPNPSANTDYYLIKDGIITSDKGVINGNRIDYTISEAGLYGIYAEVHHNYTTCISQLADDKFITITESANPEARIYSVDDGYDCNNGDIVTVVASQIDITYSIYSNVTNDAVPGYSIVGTGSDISFPDIVDSNGSYYVVAENAAGCSVELLDGSGNRDFIVNIAGAVKKYMLTEPTSICLGDDGVEIVMQDSEAGIRYTLYNSAGVALQDSISIGGSFTFKEKVYNEDVYSVRAINPADPACENEMLNTVTVKYNPLPKAFNLTGSGFYCESTPALIGVGGSEWEVSYTLMYHKPTGKDFIETIQGSYYGDSIAFAGVLQEGIYSVYAKSEFGCTSSMKDSVVVKKQPTPQSFNVHVPVIQYCASAGGAEIYLSGMEQGVTYLVDNANSNEVISVKAESAQSDTTLLTKVTAGTYNVFATWGGDACSVQLNTTPIVISTAPVATVVPNISIDNSVNCYGQDNYIHVDNATASTIYDLMVDGVAQNLDINSDDATVQWNYAGIAGKAQLIEVLAYIDGYKECALRSDVKFVDTKASPAKFDVTPDTSYYCQGLSGVQLSVNNSEAAVLYELVDSISNVTISTFTPTAAQAGNPFTFTNAASAGKYIVRASYLSGCSSLMNNTAVVTMKSSLVNTPAILLDTNNGCSGEPNNVTLSNLENSSVYYLLVDGISTDTIITGESTLPADTSWVFNGTIDKNQTVQVQGFKLTDTECYLMSNVETVTTRQSPKVFDISPTDSTFCMGLDGVQITVSGSEVNVFYEVINKATQMREDYYMPVENDVPFTFRTPMLDGLYFVKARYLTGGCSSIMNNEADIKEDDGSNSTCIPLVAVPDVMYLSKNDITDTTVVWTNDTINSPLVDRIGDNIEFELIPDDGEGKETIGTVTFNALTGQFVYTKVPGFHGRDYFKYIIRNKNVNNRQDTALVTIMVGNYEMEGSLLIPNAFSPNGDEFNQTFVIDGMIKDNDQVIEVTDSRVKSSLEVYNRWGTLVYRSKGDKYNNDWDGTNKGNMISLGSDLPNGTYFYIFNIVVNLSNKTIDRTYNGFIELRR